MSISYSTHERLPLFEEGVTYAWGAIINGAFEDWDEGKHLYLQAGEDIAQYDAIFINTDGKMYKADATFDAKLPARGISVAAVTSGDYGRIVVFGNITNAGWSWSPGLVVYTSETAGSLTQTKPEKAHKVGYARTATELIVMPSLERTYEIVVNDEGSIVTHNGEVVYN